MGDRFGKRYVYITTFIQQPAGVFILANVTNMGLVWLFLITNRFGYEGGIPVFFALKAEYFGRKAFATIQDFMFFFMMEPTVPGPIFVGYVYDVTGNYSIAFTTFGVLYLIGVVPIFFCRCPMRIPGSDNRAMIFFLKVKDRSIRKSSEDQLY